MVLDEKSYKKIVDEAFIILYRTVNQYYLYDVLKDEVKFISKQLYDYINNPQILNSDIAKEIDELTKKGNLKKNNIQRIECSVGNYKKALDSGVSVMVFQITQMCNLKCKYCPHAQDNNPRMRTHTDVKMSKEMAFAGIDFLAAHSRDKKDIDISFFGGEPLIEFGLIKDIVLYAERKLSEKKLTFNISTNGILLTQEKIDFFVKHRFCVCISIDGPRSIHDENRQDWNGRGSFKTVYNNFCKLKKLIENTETKIIINSVLDKQCDLVEEERFLSELESEKVKMLPDLVDDLSSTVKHCMSDDFLWRITYIKFLVMLSLINKINLTDLPVIARVYSSGLNEFTQLFHEICAVDHTISSVFQNELGDSENSFKLYLNCWGNFYPVVGVNEFDADMVIGNIEEGIKINKMQDLLYMAAKYKESCKQCPALSYCKLGVTCFVEEKGITEHIRKEYCENFLELFYEAVGLAILQGERKEYYQSLCVAKDNKTNKYQIIHNLYEIISSITSKPIKGLHLNESIPLTSRQVGMSALELVYVLFEVEKQYGITIDTEDVLDYGFSSVEKITDFVIEKRGRLYES